MRQKFFLILGSFFLGSCASTETPHSPAAKCAFTILHTNDHHGHPLRFDNFPEKDVGGLPARMSYVNSVRKSTKNVLVLDAGDINTGRPESNFFDAEPDIKGYNAIGYDAVALGNHEFDKSPQVLAKQISNAKFAFVNANIRQNRNKETIEGVRPYIIKDFGDCKVAVFGLLLSETRREVNEANAAHLTFEDETKAAAALVPELRNKADFVVALTHLGIESTNESGSRKLAAMVPGIDLIVDGHTHTKITEALLEKNLSSQKNIPIVQAHQWGLVVGKTDVVVGTSGQNTVHFENVSMNAQQSENETLKRELSEYALKLEPILAQRVGTANGNFEIGKHREMETPIANLLADAILRQTKSHKADFVLVNAGSIRAPLKTGTITQKQIFEMLPYDNTLVVITLAGNQVRSLFKTAATIAPGKGAFPSIAGAAVEFSRSQKIPLKILIDGKPLDDTKTYRVATHSFLATGGDGYDAFKSAKQTYDTSLFLRDAMVEYIKNKKSVSPRVENRIVFKD